MSTIKVNSIKNTATNDGGIAIDNSGHVQIDGQQLATAGALSHRNLVDNGGMSIAQRGTSESGLTDSPKFVVDRFSYRRVGAWGTNSFTMSQQSSGAPDGFTHFLRLAQSGTAAAPPADTACKLSTALEGFNTAQTGFGTSAAKDLTLSFYAKGSIAGTYCFALLNQDADQAYVAEYSLTTSWTRFKITIPARTTGTWLTDNGKGFDLLWTVAADSDSTTYSGSAGWNAANARWTSNQIETFASTSGATFDLCGVQLEIGEKATPFEHKSYSEELARCQRYCFRYSGLSAGRPMIATGQCINSTQIRCPVKFAVPLRTTPTVSESGLEFIVTTNQTVSMYSNATDGALTGAGLFIQADSGTPFTAGQAGVLRMEAATPSAFLQFDSDF